MQVLIIRGTEVGGICTRQIEYFNKCPLPTFASKQCAKMSGGIFSGAYGTLKGRHKMTEDYSSINTKLGLL